jgi:micrococcal nuclease
LLKKQNVRLNLNPDRETHDNYGRYLAYVYREDGLFVNEFLISNGFAREYTVGKAYDMQMEFRQAQAEAQRQNLGLWAACRNS